MIAALAFFVGIASTTVAQNTATDDGSQQNITSKRRGEMRGMGNFQRGYNVGKGADALSEEQTEKLQAARTEFQTDTRDLRTELQSKKLVLRSELVKTEPDANVAKALQKEISALNAELAQKRIEHILEMKKIAPYAGMGLVEKDTDSVGKNRGRRST